MWDDYAGLPPFRRGHAAEHGLTDADVRRLLRRGVLVRQAHGLLVGYRRLELVVEQPHEIALRVQAMQRRYPIGMAGFKTAGGLHRLWLIGGPGPVHLVRSHGYPREKYDVWVETAFVPPHHRCIVEGVVATSMARTAVDLAGRLPGGEAQAVTDSALRLGVTPQELAVVAEELGVDPHSVAATIISSADARPESALESLSRWLFIVAKLPVPELQAVISDDDGPFARVDFYWRKARVVGEADGMLKYDVGATALREEKRRQERLEQRGLTVVRWSYDEVMNQPHQTVARVRAALLRAA